jgi:hypothetical protein
MTAHVVSFFDIKDTLTGQIVTSRELEGAVFNAYIWAEGNFACDCNRYLFFMRAQDYALSEETDGESSDHACTDDAPRFRIAVYGQNATLLYDDTRDARFPFRVS